MSTVREHLGLLWLLRHQLQASNPQYDRNWAMQAALFSDTHLDDLIALASGADVEGWVRERDAEIPANFPYKVEQEAAQVAPPGAQEAVAIVRDTQKDGVYAEILSEEIANALPEGTLLYTAPVPAATPAEQPEGKAERECTCPSGNGSLAWPCPQHPPEGADVMRRFGAPAGQHDASDSTTVDCPACNGKGMIGGHTGQTPESYEEVTMGCDECGGQGKVIVSRQDLARATATNTNQPEGGAGGQA